jgi:hypothetical protein
VNALHGHNTKIRQHFITQLVNDFTDGNGFCLFYCNVLNGSLNKIIIKSNRDVKVTDEAFELSSRKPLNSRASGSSHCRARDSTPKLSTQTTSSGVHLLANWGPKGEGAYRAAGQTDWSTPELVNRSKQIRGVN